MAHKKKTPEPIPMPQSRPQRVERSEPVERCGHIDQPLLLLTMLLLCMGLICLFSASYANAYAYQDGNSTYFIFRQGIFAAAGVVVMLVL